MKIRWSRDALADLRRLTRWLMQERPIAAKRIPKRIRSQVRLLADFPDAGQLVIPEGGVRHLVVSPFRIFYRVLPGEVQILRVWDGRRATLEPDEIGERQSGYGLSPI